MRGLPPNDDHAPEGVLTRHFNTLRLGATIQTYQQGAFRTGLPSGFLKVTQPNFGEDKAEALKAKWMAAHGGDRKSIAVLNAQVDFTPVELAAKPVDNETTLLRHSHLVDVAHMFGLSASWLDTSAGASLTYANITEKRKELLDISLSGWGQQMMEMLNACLPYGTGVRIQWDRFTNPDLIEQATTLTQAVQSGWLTIDEARQRVGLDPLGSSPVDGAMGVQQ
jgi:HK97 family phage portal protein